MAFVHPALAVPLLTGRVGDVVRRHADGAALVAGTVGADVEYFARMSARPWLHQQPLAVLAGGVAGGLLLLLLLTLGRGGLVRALPPPLAARFAAALGRSLRQRGALRIAVGLVVGALLHLAWDAVTTRQGLLAGVVPWRMVATASTITGVVVLVAGVALAPKAATVAGGAFSARALVVVVAGGLAGAVALAAVRLALHGSVPDAMAAASGGALLGTALAGALAGTLAGGTREP